MSNPTVNIGDSIATPSDAELEWDNWSRLTWEDMDIFTYAEGEYSAPLGFQGEDSFNPNLLGEAYIIFSQMEDAVGSSPDFTTASAWDGLKRTPSGFVNPVTHSILPTLIIPTDILVDNGFLSLGDKLKATYDDGGSPGDCKFWNRTDIRIWESWWSVGFAVCVPQGKE
jgi:hypothetical protein